MLKSRVALGSDLVESFWPSTSDQSLIAKVRTTEPFHLKSREGEVDISKRRYLSLVVNHLPKFTVNSNPISFRGQSRG